jgi:chromosome segregation and condensation protein ScpB
MIRGLIEQRKAEDVEKYLITHDFLKHLGITSTRDLPDYERLSRDKNLADLLERARESHKSINSEP